MTQLAAAVNSTEELWTVDTLPSTQYVAVEDETVEVRAMFPSQIFSLTGQATAPQIRVRRAQGGTSATSHNNGTTLTALYGIGGGAGGGMPSQWVASGPSQITSNDSITFQTADGFAFSVTSGEGVEVQAQASIELTSDAGGVALQAAEDVTIAAGETGVFISSDGGPVTIYSPIKLNGLPTSDPGVNRQLYTDGAPSAGNPKALMISGG